MIDPNNPISVHFLEEKLEWITGMVFTVDGGSTG